MEEKNKDNRNHRNEGASNQKTNQDPTKHVPNPNDHKQDKKFQIGEDGKETQKREITSKDDHQATQGKGDSKNPNAEYSDRTRVDNANQGEDGKNKEKDPRQNEKREERADSKRNEVKTEKQHENLGKL